MRILHQTVPFRAQRIAVGDEHVWIGDGLDAEELFKQNAALVVRFGVGGGGGGEAFEGDGVLGSGGSELAGLFQRSFSSLGISLHSATSGTWFERGEMDRRSTYVEELGTEDDDALYGIFQSASLL